MKPKFPLRTYKNFFVKWTWTVNVAYYSFYKART